MGCIALTPATDSLEAALGERATVLRLDIHSALGSELAARYRVDFVPTIITFGGDGREILRGNTLPSLAQVLRQ